MTPTAWARRLGCWRSRLPLAWIYNDALGRPLGRRANARELQDLWPLKDGDPYADAPGESRRQPASRRDSLQERRWMYMMIHDLDTHVMWRVEAHRSWDAPFVPLAFFVSRADADDYCRLLSAREQTSWEEPRIIKLDWSL